ncbi:MAG: class I tRNA ligase family protein, partial [Euryarchaeota archaeon]
LLDELDHIEFPENVKAMQRNWIGRSHGAHIEFPVVGDVDGESASIGAFTTRPDTIFGVTFVTLSPEHPLCESLVSGTEYEQAWRDLAEECARMTEFERINMLKEKKGVPLGRFATNPITGEEVPIYAGNFVVASYGTGAVMAVPGHDQRDYDFAKKYELEIKPVLSRNEGGEAVEENPVFDGLGWMVNSTIEGFDGLFGNDAKNAVISALEQKGAGHGSTEYRLKDWLLSRQRFWGTPIPMLHCDSCGVVPVPYEQLPVELPLDVTFSWEESGNPLARSESFLTTTCPQCNGPARRETDTMDTFYDSSWYFMRFVDSSNDSAPFNREAVDYWMNGGVDLYIGGIEHAVMHLLYARFFTKATRDLGMNEVSEPFGRLVCQGMLNAPAPFCVDCNTEYHIDNFGGDCPNCGQGLGSRSAKMSKSLGNTVSPGEMVDRFGADTVRLFILFGANPEAGMDWSDNAVIANHKQVCSIIDAFNHGNSLSHSPGPMDSWLLARLRVNQNRWRECMEAVSLREGVMSSHFEMLSDWHWYLRRGGADRDTARQYLRGWAPMLAPATPHIAEEFWSELSMGEASEMLATHEMTFYSGEGNDATILARESYLRGVIESARNLRGLAERHSDAEISGVVIQTAPSWKAELSREAVNLASEDFDFKAKGQDHLKSMAIFENEALRGEIFQTWMALTMGSKKKRGRIHTWAEGEKQLILSGLDESEVINSAADFIAAVLEVNSVVAYPVGEGEDIGGKARFAFPLEPGIAFV